MELIDNLFQKYVDKTAKKVIGLSVYVQNDGSYLFYVIVLEKNKGGDLQVESFNRFSTVEELSNWISEGYEKYPILWGVEGRSVLLKVSELNNGLNKTSLIGELVPNADVNEFQINYQTIDDVYFSALIRKETFDGIASLFKTKEIKLYKGYIGPIVYFHLREHLIENKEEVYQFGQYQIDETGQLIKLSRNSEEVGNKVNSSYEFTHEYLNAFGYATSFFTQGSNNAYTEETQASAHMANEFIHERVYKKLSVFIISFLLLIFFANTIYFLNLNSKNGVLKESSSNVQQLINTYDRSKKQFDEKNKIVEKLNYNNIGMAWISDQIGALVPRNVTMTLFQVDPISKDKRKKGTPFDEQVLLIKGESNNNESFGGLIDNLQGLDFVAEIMYQSYQFNQAKKKGEFEIRLKYKTGI